MNGRSPAAHPKTRMDYLARKLATAHSGSQGLRRNRKKDKEQAWLRRKPSLVEKDSGHLHGSARPAKSGFQARASDRNLTGICAA
jgi:hypothetical protein